MKKPSVGKRPIDKLSEEENLVLQGFLNYSKAIDKHRAQEFVTESNKRAFDTEELDKILKIILEEDIRFLPVLSCSFCDEQLKSMFSREISDNVPGGRASMLSGFGGLSRFSQRIQIAYAFDWMNRDILEELNKLRKIRNDLSHSWDIAATQIKLTSLIELHMSKIEEQLELAPKLPEKFWEKLSNEALLRIRLAWLVGRCYYESQLFVPAKKLRLSPSLVLYGNPAPRLLVDIAKRCFVITEKMFLNTKTQR